jgi:hypothetical protein
MASGRWMWAGGEEWCGCWMEIDGGMFRARRSKIGARMDARRSDSTPTKVAPTKPPQLKELIDRHHLKVSKMSWSCFCDAVGANPVTNHASERHPTSLHRARAGPPGGTAARLYFTSTPVDYSFVDQWKILKGFVPLWSSNPSRRSSNRRLWFNKTMSRARGLP